MSEDDHSVPSVSVREAPSVIGISRRRRRSWPTRLLRSLVAIGIFLVLAAVVSAFIQIPYYAIVPGSGVDVGTLISVRTHTASHRGAVLLTDVDLVSLRALDYLYYRFDSDAEIVPQGQLVGPATSSQYQLQGVIDMANARVAATVVGLRALGYQVQAIPTGVIAYQPVPGSPAYAALAVGDVITGVNGHSILTGTALHDALTAASPRTPVVITYHPFGSATVKHVTVRLGETVTTRSGSSCVVAKRGQLPAGTMSCLGIELEQQYRAAGEPFPVTIDSKGIVGPSAGLAFTLGLIDKLDAASLTRGHKIAATGTMAIDGTVGDVGGVAQKTVAVQRAGATAFLVPTVELAVARAHAGPGLHIYPVANLAQALSDLRSLGGKVARSKTGP